MGNKYEDIYNEYKDVDVKSLNQLPQYCSYLVSLTMQFKKHRLPEHTLDFGSTIKFLKLLEKHKYMVGEWHGRDNCNRSHSLCKYWGLTDKAIAEYKNEFRWNTEG